MLFGKQSLDRACHEIASVGLRSVDIWHVQNWCEHLSDGVPAVRQTLQRHGLSVQSVSAYNWPVERLPELIDTLADLGGRVLITGSTKPDITVREFAERIRPVIERAEAREVVLGIENHANATIDSIASMREMVAAAPSSALGVALAPIHLYNRNESTMDAIHALGDRVALCYAWDWGEPGLSNWKDPTHQFLGTGRIDHRPIFAALRAIGHQEPIQIFAHGAEHGPPDVATKALTEALRVARGIAREVEG